MPAATSLDNFLELARRSGAIDPRRLEAFLGKYGPLPDDPAVLADALVQAGLMTRFHTEPLLQGQARRFILSGKYRLLDRLGAGGMASVFLCEHRIMRRRVAIKMLPPKMAEDPSALDRFHREARAVASVDHPNIVRAHDVDQDGKINFLVIEYIEGTSFHDLVVQHGPLSVARACHYAAQAAHGLQHAHEKGLVHRDIKPANLLLDRSGTVKVLDLGLALVFHDEDTKGLTQQYDANAILGTAEYLAPEQAMDSHKVDHRVDIYSLGMTLYFMLSGHTPYGEGSTYQKLIWHQLREPTPLKEYNPDVPDELWEVILKLLAKKPEDRYQTMHEVADALAPWTAEPIAPPDESEMPKPLMQLATDGPMTEAGYAAAGASTMALPTPLDVAANAKDTAKVAAGSTGRPNTPARTAPRTPPRVPLKPASGPPASAPRAKTDSKSLTVDPKSLGKPRSGKTPQKLEVVEDEKGPSSEKLKKRKKREAEEAKAKSKRKVLIASAAVGGIALLLTGALINWLMAAKPNPTYPQPAAKNTADAPTKAKETKAKDKNKGSGKATPAKATEPKPTEKTAPKATAAPKPTEKTPPPKKAPPPPPPPTITAAFFPLTPRELEYESFVDGRYLIPPGKGWLATRVKVVFKDDGDIEVTNVKYAGVSGPDVTPAKWLPPPKQLAGTIQHKVRAGNGMIEYGAPLDLRVKDLTFEPILKIGTKKGETWTAATAGGNRTYTVLDIVKAGGKETATVQSVLTVQTTPSPVDRIETREFVKDVGEVSWLVELVGKPAANAPEQRVPISRRKLLPPDTE